MSGQICDELLKKPWKPYDVSLADNVPGIYDIGETRGSETEDLYIGRTNNLRRRLQEHKSRNRQDVDKKVTKMFKQNQGSRLKIKFVAEEKQKSLEGAYMQCVTQRNGYRPVLNKREGDCCESCARGKKRKRCQRNGASKRNAKVPRTSSFKRRRPFQSSSGPKASSTTSIRRRYPVGHKRSSGRPSFKSSSGPKASSTTSIRGRYPVSHKRSSGRPSFKSFTGPKASSTISIRGRYPVGHKRSSGRPSFKSSGGSKASSTTSIRQRYPVGHKRSWGRPAFK